MRPPGPNDPLPYEWWRFYQGDYVPCPNCEAPNLFDAEEITCRNDDCGATIVDEGDLLHLPVCPNFDVFIKGGGPRGKGGGAVCRCLNGHMKDRDGRIRPCAVCHYSDLRRAEVLEAADSDPRYKGMDRLPSEVWIKALALQPRARAAHNLIRLQWFHEIEREARKSGKKFKDYVLCTEGIRPKKGRAKMKCEHCQNGVPRVFGKRGFWNPTEPVSAKGHLATLRRYEEETLRWICRNCQNALHLVGFTCPACNEEVIDCYDEAYSTETLNGIVDEALNKEQTCPHCGHHDMLNENLICVVIDEAGDIVEGEDGEPVLGCKHPEKTMIWDVDLAVSISGKGTDSQMVIHDHRFSDLTEEVVDLMIPYDFKNLWDQSIEEQCRQMGKDSPFETRNREGRSDAARKGIRGRRRVEKYD